MLPQLIQIFENLLLSSKDRAQLLLTGGVQLKETQTQNSQF